MAEFVIEVYVPRPQQRAVAREAERLRELAEQLSTDRTEVRYLRSLYIPEDETCFFVFEADSAITVERLAARSGLAGPRVAQADVPPTPTSNAVGRRA